MRIARLFPVLPVLLLAAPLPGQQTKPAGEIVVIPNLPGLGPNQEIRLAPSEMEIGEMTGPEIPFTAQVVQWEEGRSITVRLPNGETRVVPVPSTIQFPPDLRPGGSVTVLVRQTSEGRYRVTGLTTAYMVASPLSPPPQAQPAPAPAAAPAPAPPAPAPATVSSPPVSTQPGAPAPRGKTVVGASYLTVSGTVKAYEKGVSITIAEPSGREKTLSLADGASVPPTLAVGETVRVRVPLQKPFDGKTADRVERPSTKKAPPPSKFHDAQVPKN